MKLQAADLLPPDPRVVSANDRLERLQLEHRQLGNGSDAIFEQPQQQNVAEDNYFDETAGLVC